MENSGENIRLSDTSYLTTEEFLSSTLSSLYDYSIFTIDNDLIINCWSTGATKQLGYQAEEVIGKSMDMIYPEEDRKEGIPLKDKEMALKEGKATGNRWYRVKDGSRFYAYGLMYPIKDKNGRILGFVKILRDITQRKIAEDAIQRHIKELEELIIHKENILAILSHDLRSPLSTIIQITDYLQADIDEMRPEDIKHMLTILHQSSTDELHMLDYLLEWARIKHASDVFSPFEFNLKELAMKVYETFYEHSMMNSLTLKNEIPEGTTVFADKMMIMSVIQNLVSNALKFTPAGGSITISSLTEPDKVVVKIEDTGIGMSMKKLNQLFKPELKRLSHSRGENKGGGIGLLLVKGFMDKNKGAIWAESTVGKGTTFYFTLPKQEDALQTADVLENEYKEEL